MHQPCFSHASAMLKSCLNMLKLIVQPMLRPISLTSIHQFINPSTTDGQPTKQPTKKTNKQPTNQANQQATNQPQQQDNQPTTITEQPTNQKNRQNRKSEFTGDKPGNLNLRVGRKAPAVRRGGLDGAPVKSGFDWSTGRAAYGPSRGVSSQI